MPRWRSQDFHCDDCQFRFAEIVEFPADAEFGIEACPESPCPHCGSSSRPALSAPCIMQRSIPDGLFRSDSYQMTKEIARLRSDSFDLPPEKRGDLNGEIDRVEGEIRSRGLRDKFDTGKR